MPQLYASVCTDTRVSTISHPWNARWKQLTSSGSNFLPRGSKRLTWCVCLSVTAKRQCPDPPNGWCMVSTMCEGASLCNTFAMVVAIPLCLVCVPAAISALVVFTSLSICSISCICWHPE